MGSEKRQFQREKHRVGCEFRVKGEVHNGIVSDLSARGVFIQSSFRPEEGYEIELVLREHEIGEIRLHGRVARLKRSHRSAAAVLTAGFGVQIDTAPENFFELLVKLGLG